ncbi:MAG TPA: hypothetical protein VFQ12_09215 [Thermoleophilaceae bacterium]|nr:hypothetical protein [Thermoleophilaceae bacterium]
MAEPRRIWWARPRKLCALERPGGGGRSHRPERREAEIEYLKGRGVHLVISVMRTRHNLAAYESAGLEWRHVPVGVSTAALEELLPLLRRELRRSGAVAVHGDRRTGFVSALCAAHLHESRGHDPVASLAAAAAAGLDAGEEACALVGVDPRELERRLNAARAMPACRLSPPASGPLRRRRRR